MNEAIEIMCDFKKQSEMLIADLKTGIRQLYEEYFELLGITPKNSSAELVEVTTNGLLIQFTQTVITIFPVSSAEPLVDYSDKGRFEYNNLTMAQLKKCVETVKNLDRCALAKAICTATTFSTPDGE